MGANERKPFEPGFIAQDRVCVSGKAGTVQGEVLDVRRISQLPDLEDGQGPEARAILDEGGVDVLAMIRYRYGGRSVVFAALHTRTGWHDLKGQTLTISRRSAGDWPTVTNPTEHHTNP